MRVLRIGIIGAGKMGTALALGLDQAGYAVTTVASRSLDSARLLAGKLSSVAASGNPQSVADSANLIFITTPDGIIAEVAASLKVCPGQMVCHVSAATPVNVLKHLSDQGAFTGVFHPLQSAGSLEKASILPGITFAIEASTPLLELLKTMASRLGGRVIELSASDRVLYHVSAVLASNYLVTLIDRAAGLWQGFSTKEQAVTALLPLIRGTVDNIEAIGAPACLTGPISRGDTSTVQRHLTTLTDKAPDGLNIYRAMGLETIPLAVVKGGISNDKAAALKELLETRS